MRNNYGIFKCKHTTRVRTNKKRLILLILILLTRHIRRRCVSTVCAEREKVATSATMSYQGSGARSLGQTANLGISLAEARPPNTDHGTRGRREVVVHDGTNACVRDRLSQTHGDRLVSWWPPDQQ